MYYGQHGEDKYIFETFFGTKKNGVFLELGAIDGIQFSNTYYLEKNQNWSGVLIEPTQAPFKDLVVNRPNSRCYNCAISTTKDQVEFDIYQEPAMNRIKGLSFVNKPSYSLICPTKYLSEVLEDADIKYIDFFSLDVEGAELEVLKTMNWDIPVHVILAEIKATNKYSKEKNEQCKRLLTDKGFVYHSSTETDEVWVNPNFESV